MARKQSSADNENQRTALIADGRLGSYYDGYRESLLAQLTIREEDKSIKSVREIQCILSKGKANEHTNLLQKVHMPVVLRISVLSEPTLRKGIASIMDYPHEINAYTRFLYYSYVRQKEKISDKITKQNNMNNPPTFNTITHIITGVNYGIDLVVVLQLPSNNDIGKKIHDVLELIRTSLSDDQSPLVLIQEKHELLQQIITIMVYSNISTPIRMSTMHDVCSFIDLKKKDAENYPVLYTLQPITWMFPQHTGHGAHFTPLATTLCEKVERYLLEFFSTFKRAKYSIDNELTLALSGKLDKKLDEARKQVLTLKNKYDIWRKRVHDLVFEIRKNRANTSSLEKILDDMEKKIPPEIEKLTKLMEHLHDKGKFVADLEKDNIIFTDAANRNVTHRDNDNTLIEKLKIKKQLAWILCTTDTLNKKNARQYEEQRRLLARKRQDQSEINVIYADFSYCPFELRAIKTLQSKPKENKMKKKTPVRKPTSSSKPEKNIEVVSSSVNDDVINILLLGESGVGKSTFINAFVNYLTSETFNRAQSTEPVVLIPVSFVLTSGDDFKEHTVKFGDFVTSHNEDFDHPAESVTQFCKTYEFDHDLSDGKKLCIIDTPGFGDTRGIEQDDMNMQHILEYINNLTHVNAVCFLLKPNTSRISSFFRLCFTQLLDLMGPSIRQNIIFCFTNARSTFYAPGDTAPLLKQILNSLPVPDIPFNRNNTFCFDNESFRYLVALRNAVPFSDANRSEYEKSWDVSVQESNRLIKYICCNLEACSVHSGWQSNKHAQIAIRDMIRPMLESMRNIFRNILLHQIESPQKCIELCAKPMHRPGALCYVCPTYPIRMTVFSIVQEITHEFRKNCSDCSCDIKEHTFINYVLNFEVSTGSSIYRDKRIIDKAHEICHAGAEFDFFLTQLTGLSTEEPFAKGLKRMIAEENDLCQNQQSNQANIQLSQELTKLQQEYDQTIAKFHSNRQKISLSNIYQSITTLGSFPPIRLQLDAIKETQKQMTEPYETSFES